MAAETNISGLDQATEAAGSLCWNCSAAVAADAHFCPNCGKVQQAYPTDHFTFFGLQRKLNFDLATLEKEFYRLSRKLHPDVYSNASAQEQESSLEKSSQLNDAYRTLRDPILRTQYLLELEGVQLEEQSSSATAAARANGQEKKQVVPPELLEEVFELNMQLQELRMNRQMGEDDPNITRELTAAKSKFEASYDDLLRELQRLWNKWDAVVSSSSVRDADRSAVRDELVDLLNHRNYIRNLVRDVNEALAS